MTKTAAFFLLAALLQVTPAAAQSVVPDPKPGAGVASQFRFSKEVIDAALSGERMVIRQAVAPKKSTAGRLGAILGLAAGVAASVIYWDSFYYCEDGSDAIFTHCVLPSSAMIVGGWLGGRAIGRAIDRRKP